VPCERSHRASTFRVAFGRGVSCGTERPARATTRHRRGQRAARRATFRGLFGYCRRVQRCAAPCNPNGRRNRGDTQEPCHRSAPERSWHPAILAEGGRARVLFEVSRAWYLAPFLLPVDPSYPVYVLSPVLPVTSGSRTPRRPVVGRRRAPYGPWMFPLSPCPLGITACPSPVAPCLDRPWTRTLSRSWAFPAYAWSRTGYGRLPPFREAPRWQGVHAWASLAWDGGVGVGVC
jgi:hypothetical protein